MLLERGALAAADSLQILGLGRHAFGEDRLVAAAAGSAVLVAQRLDEGRDRARIPAHLEQAGLGGLRCQPIAVGLAVVALAVSAGRFAQPQAEHQHEQMPQRLDPAAIVAQAERRELGGVVGERVAIRVAGCRLGHLQRRRVALGELALHGRKHHGHALDVSQRGRSAARERRVGGEPRDVVHWQRRPVKHRILPLAARQLRCPRRRRRPRCIRHPRCARSCDATSAPAATDLVPTDPVRFIEELVVRQPQAPLGLRRDQAKHETIASGSHGGTHTVRLYYNLWQYICN